MSDYISNISRDPTLKAPDEVTDLRNQIGALDAQKVSKEDGKGLSTCDFTISDKNKVHDHSNKSVLNDITSEKVARWDAGGVSVAGKEDTANKVYSLSESSTDEQYPSAKATVDYVRQKVSSIYKPFGSTTLHNLLPAHTFGMGAVYNMLDEGSRTFKITDSLGTARYYAGYITFPFPLPGEGFVSLTLADGSTMQMQTYTLKKLVQTEYLPNVYSYKDVDGVLSGYAGSVDFAIAGLSYTLSVKPGDNVVCTGYYWDNLGSYVDLSGYATKTNIVEGVSGASVTLAHNTEYRIGEMPAAFEFFFPSNFDIDYISSLVFSTGGSVPQLEYPTDIRWSGDDIDEEFVPVASKHYTLVFWYDGTYLNGVVRGVDNE